jgi:lysophospholipase L1-like esterase
MNINAGTTQLIYLAANSTARFVGLGSFQFAQPTSPIVPSAPQQIQSGGSVVGPYPFETRVYVFAESVVSISSNDLDINPNRQVRNPENTLIFMGDSIAGSSYSETATSSAYLDFGFMSWAQALSGARFEILNPNAAQGGTTSRTWVTRVDTEVLPYAPGWVVCYLGTNDVGSDIPYEESIANFGSIFDRILQNGSRLVVCTVIPYGAANPLVTVARNTARNRLNAWLAQYCSLNPGAYLVDTFAIVADPASATGAARANFLYDNLHPSALGARAMGSAVAAVLSQYTVDSAAHVSGFTDNWAYDPNALNKISNPLFNSATGVAGATSPGAGTTITATSIAREWTVQSVAGGTSTTVCTTPAAPDGIGNAQRLVISGTNATDEITLRTGSLAAARLVEGDVLYGECFVRITSASALEGVRLTWLYNVNGVGRTISCMSPQFQAYDQANADLLVLRTPTFVVPPGTLTSGQLTLTAFFGGAGGATIDVWRAALRKIL